MSDLGYLPKFPPQITALILDTCYDYTETMTITLGSNFFKNVSHITYLKFAQNFVDISGNPFKLITNLKTLIWNAVNIHSTRFDLSLLYPLSLLENLEILPFYFNMAEYCVSCGAIGKFFPRSFFLVFGDWFWVSYLTIVLCPIFLV
jgi:hypothetical protein